jgi:aryl-phospho-beta-D-glucosidase BglC (GH1 family)
MPNQLLLKRKLTTGPPSSGQLGIGELCLVIPDNAIYWKKDSNTIIGPILVNPANGDMSKAVYDTNTNGRVDLADNALQLGGVLAASYATQTYVANQINALINGAGIALDTLQELAAALGNDPNFATTIATILGQKLDSSSTIDGGTISN